NTARRGMAATIYHGATPEHYELWLTAVLNQARSTVTTSGRFVFINAWNEWAEGAHLEPDQENGLALLEATRRAVALTTQTRSKNPQPQRFPLRGHQSTTSSQHGTPEKAQRDLPLLVIAHDAAAAGSQFVLLELLKELKNRSRYDVHLVLQGDGPLTEQYKHIAKTTIINGPPVPGSRAKKQLSRAIRALRSEGLRHALCNTVVTAAAAEVCRNEGLAVVTLIHEQPDSINNLFGGKATMNLINANVNQIVSVSEYSRMALEQHYGPLRPDHTVVHPPTRIFRGDQHTQQSAREAVLPELAHHEEIKIILGCGTLYPRKGPDLFIQLARSIKECQEDPFLRFIWVGGALSHDGVLQHQHSAAKAGVDDLVSFVGIQKDMTPFFKAADLFVLTSREDPFPLVNMEAMSFGLPVVAFADAGGAPELIGNDAGIVVPYLDVDAMAAAVTSLASDSAKRTAMGECARSKINESFSASAYATKILSILESHPPPPQTSHPAADSIPQPAPL
ncbi:MAG: glycosyltransferase, partial [Myxococcota bacterium]|nr:glycosyltransferase [Myxococcota bacterium]